VKRIDDYPAGQTTIATSEQIVALVRLAPALRPRIHDAMSSLASARCHWAFASLVTAF
jgi:hypothetical protein